IKKTTVQSCSLTTISIVYLLYKDLAVRMI
ncbi:hypothetical protein AZZ81_004090, partial [Klebsiella aerogenes]